MKRISILLVAVMVLSTIVASAEPFKDVPFSHWSYDAVNKLAAKGILQGYPDGTFKGKQTVTRYALAMVTAKMLANVEQMLETGVGSNLVTKADLQTLEKLTVEFADELALLGVKVTALEDDMQVVKEDVSMLKRDVDGIKDYMAKGGMEKVKLSGDMMVRHTNLITNRDGNPAALIAGNNDNSRTESQIRFKFKANIDENIIAVARWRLFTRNADNNNPANNPSGPNTGAFGVAGIGGLTAANGTIDLAYLQIKDMFRFGGDFTFGRNLYNHGHSLLLNNFVDAVRYEKRVGDVDVVFQSIYDRHQGSYNDTAAVDFRNVWNLNLDTKYRDHGLYMGIYMQDEPNNNAMTGYTDPSGAVIVAATGLYNPAAPVAGTQKSDSRWDVEFGSKGPIGKNGHWDYDLGFAYTNYELDIYNTAATTFISPEMQGWMGHVAVKWDTKKEWAAKLAYTFADDESIGAYSITNDLRYCSATETPYEDIARGNNYFRNGLMNMGDLKLQAEYRPRNTKHYFRIAGDLLNEIEETTSNDLAKYVAGHNTTAGIPVGTVKTDTAYDKWNNFATSDAEAMVFTFEYRYQLAENTKIRVGYTNFEFDGKETKLAPAVNAGRGNNGDYDYNMFWAEIFSNF